MENVFYWKNDFASHRHPIYSDKEKNDKVAQLAGKKYEIQRSKGLGENDPEMMALTTMSPATRRLIKVMPPLHGGRDGAVLGQRRKIS